MRERWKKNFPSTVVKPRRTVLEDMPEASTLHPPGPCRMVVPSIRLSAASMDP